MTDILAIDFGTSNSAAAVLENGAVRRIAIEAGAETLPTAVFFPARGPMLIGTAAAEALVAGDEGRYMRALKSVLGTPLARETRRFGGTRRSILDIVAAFLAQIKNRAEAQIGQSFNRVLSGRPVHFHTRAPQLDAQAEADLRECYLAAGFTDVSFLPEPEAAALAAHDSAPVSGLGLIVDIGGGTSDFTVFESRPEGARIIESHGIKLGGTDFDRAISMSHVMPALGLGTMLRREMGDGLLPMPSALFLDLATWAKIPFLYTPETLRKVQSMTRLAQDADALRRFETVLRDELGHELAFSVERGKIEANRCAPDAAIRMGFIQSRLSRPIDTTSMDATLEGARAELYEAAAHTLEKASVSPEVIGTVVLVGGSSLMQLVGAAAVQLCPNAQVRRGEAFTGIVDGLALATA